MLKCLLHLQRNFLPKEMKVANYRHIFHDQHVDHHNMPYLLTNEVMLLTCELQFPQHEEFPELFGNLTTHDFDCLSYVQLLLK